MPHLKVPEFRVAAFIEHGSLLGLLVLRTSTVPIIAPIPAVTLIAPAC